MILRTPATFDGYSNSAFPKDLTDVSFLKTTNSKLDTDWNIQPLS